MTALRGTALLAAVALTALTAREATDAFVAHEPVAQAGFRYGAETNTSPGGTDLPFELHVLVGEYFDTRADAYAGTYLDPGTGDLVVLVTRDLDRHRRALDALRRAGDPRVVVRPAAYAYDDLVRVVDAVMDRADALRARGVEVTGGGPDSVANRATVMLLHDTPYARDTVLATLPPRDRAMVTFVEAGYATLL